MGERVTVRQNNRFEIEIMAPDPHDPEAEELQPVGDVRYLTPYGMLLAGLGSCTAVVLHTYAQYHGLDLHQAELRLEYDRVFAEDCQDCEQAGRYEEQIEEQIVLSGHLTLEERKKLFAISKQCPIHKMLAQGVVVRSRLADEAAPATPDG